MPYFLVVTKLFYYSSYLNKLQAVQDLKKFDHVAPVLKDLRNNFISVLLCTRRFERDVKTTQNYLSCVYHVIPFVSQMKWNGLVRHRFLRCLEMASVLDRE